MRYGHQQWSELKRMSYDEKLVIVSLLNDIIEAENTPPPTAT